MLYAQTSDCSKLSFRSFSFSTLGSEDLSNMVISGSGYEHKSSTQLKPSVYKGQPIRPKYGLKEGQP